MDVHDPPNHTRFVKPLPQPAGPIEVCSIGPRPLQKPNFRVAHGSGVDDDKRAYRS
jgi:hypothetical protein